MSMDALILRTALVLSVFTSAGAVHRTPNFVVNAPTPEFARAVGEHAEHFRREIAVAWLGKPLPKWFKPCQVTVKVGQMGSGGATTFAFDRGEVFGWRMNIQGSHERILDSVLPHEVSHTIFACHFRRPLPRWADEGAATLVEHDSEKRRQQLLCRQVLDNGRRIPLRKLLQIREYPRDMQDVLTLYAEGYSLADFLVQGGGKTRYLKFLEDAHHRGWDQAVRTHYGFEGVDGLEKKWNGWIMAGSPRIDVPAGAELASAELSGRNTSSRSRGGNRVVRGQSPRRAAAAGNRAPESQPPAPSRNGRQRFATPDPRSSDEAHAASVATLAGEPRRSRGNLTLPVGRLASQPAETTARREQAPATARRSQPSTTKGPEDESRHQGNAQWSVVPEEPHSPAASPPARRRLPVATDPFSATPDLFPPASTPADVNLPDTWPGSRPAEPAANGDGSFAPNVGSTSGNVAPLWAHFPHSNATVTR